MTTGSKLLANRLDDSDFRSNRLAVASVCRYWRSIALSYPELFSYLDISTHRQTDFIAKYLEYSKRFPLFILIESSDSTILRYVTPHVSRIPVMTMHTEFFTSHRCDNDTFPVFHATHTFVCCLSYNTTQPQLDQLLTHFPTLDRSCIIGSGVGVMPSISLPRLTHLTLIFSSGTPNLDNAGLPPMTQSIGIRACQGRSFVRFPTRFYA